jgi:hypothetical protein
MMPAVAGSPPLFHLASVKMHGEEIFEVHIREKKIGNIFGFLPIVVHVGIVVASVPVPINPDQNPGSVVVLPRFLAFSHHQGELAAIRRPREEVERDVFLLQIPV